MTPYAIGRLTTNVRFYVISIGGHSVISIDRFKEGTGISFICNFHVTFRENWQNKMLTPPHPLSNLESAIAITIANVLKKKLSLSPESMIWCEF